MSLFSSIQLANNSLRAAQIGLQVVGQNIANANTPGYIREEVNFKPAPTQRVGGLLLGLGVQVDSVVQKVDKFLESRLRGSTSDRVSSETQEQTYQQLEGLVGELGDNGLSTSINDFFSSLNEVLNQPESVSVRNLAVLKGKTLAQDVNHLQDRVSSVRADVNKRVAAIGDDINRLIEQVRKLNVRIAETEGGDVSKSDAVGLRDQRNQALGDLAKLIDIRVEEQPSGGVAVFAGGDYLVFESQSRSVKVAQTTDRGQTVAEIRVKDTDSPLDVKSGELVGLYKSRDDILGGFQDKLDEFSRTLISEFNKVYSSGQGLKGFGQLTSEFGVNDPSAALDAAGLTYPPVNGSLQIQVFNRTTGLTQTTDIPIDLNGLDHDTSLSDVAAAINAIDGVSASISTSGKLTISSDSPDQEIAFANDTSGLLTALGLNTFFTGTSAATLGINQDVAGDPAKFAASSGGVGEDTANGVALAGFLDRPLESNNGDTLVTLYSAITSDVTQGSAVTKSVAEGFRTFEAALQGQSLATSGVSLDEEAIKMITLQRTFQASAKYIAALSELLDILVKL